MRKLPDNYDFMARFHKPTVAELRKQKSEKRKKKRIAIQRTKEWVATHQEQYHAYRHNYHRTARRRFLMGQSSAKSRNLTWSIAFSEYEDILRDSCYYCHESLETTGIGLDRVNNDFGYDPGNVVACCRRCNWVKGAYFTADETKIMIEALLKYRNNINQV